MSFMQAWLWAAVLLGLVALTLIYRRTMDDWQGEPYDDDPARWKKTDSGVVRFVNVDAPSLKMARLLAESANTGFKAQHIRPLGKGVWRVELWKERL